MMNIKRIFTDQMQREVTVTFPPKRIVSLVPSQTELLYSLGLSNEVVGQTLFCIHPQKMHEQKIRVGGTKKPSIEKILALNPDLIIGNKEENDKETIEELAKHCPVWMSDIQNLDDALEMIVEIGQLVNAHSPAILLQQKIKHSFEELVSELNEKTNLGVTYLIWRNPWMAAGKSTFINDMLQRMRMHNLCLSEESRYPQLSNADIQNLNPQLILLSSEPYPFKEKHLNELKNLCPNAQVILVDGELFSWYGSRLLYSANYFRALIHQINK